eukprot:g4686.t1
MHRHSSVSYGLPIDPWDVIHSPDLQPANPIDGAVSPLSKKKKEEWEVSKENVEDVTTRKVATNKKTLRSAARKVKHALAVVRSLKERGEKVSKQRNLHLFGWIVVTVLCGCAVTIPVEFLLKRDEYGTRLNVLASYLFTIVSSSYVVGPAKIWRDRKISLSMHVLIAGAALGYNILLTMAFARHLPMSIALVLKNGGLLFQMLVGFVVLGESYSKTQLVAAVCVTIGIIVTVFANTSRNSDSRVYKNDDDGGNVSTTDTLSSSVACLLAAMLCRSLGNVAQQSAYRNYGKRVNEVLFMSHAIGLPIILWGGGSGNGHILAQMHNWATEHWVDVMGFPIPILFALLFVVMVLNYAMTKACAQVVVLGNSVVLNLVLTVQRFTSIFLSATLINAPPYPESRMWIGAFLVIVGCVAFFMSQKRRKRRAKQKRS